VGQSERPEREGRVHVDDLVAVDDFLCARWSYCTKCGRHAPVLDQVRMRIGPLTLGCVQCLACRNRDPETRQLHAFLVTRYRGKEQ
jgi:hypothetical protein